MGLNYLGLISVSLLFSSLCDEYQMNTVSKRLLDATQKMFQFIQCDVYIMTYPTIICTCVLSGLQGQRHKDCAAQGLIQRTTSAYFFEAFETYE